MTRLKDKAAKLLGQGRYEKAADAYRRVIAQDPRDMGSRLRLGDAYRRLSRIEPALKCYREVAEHYARDGQLLKAIATCKVILEIEPEHGFTQDLLADLYARRLGPAAARANAPDRAGRPEPGETAEKAGEGPPESNPSSSSGEAPETTGHGIFLDDDDDCLVLDSDLSFDADTSDVESWSQLSGPPPDSARIPPPPVPERRRLPPMPLLSDLERSAFRDVLAAMVLRRLEPGRVAIREGEPGESFYIVVSGTLAVTRTVEGETLRLGTIGEGQFFGEMAYLSGRPRSATVTAETDTELLELGRALLDDLIVRHAEVRPALERFHMRRLLANLFVTSPVFQPFDANERRLLYKRFEARRYPAGRFVVTEGEPAPGLFVVLKGELEALGGKGGAATRVLGALGDGDVFGEMSLLTRGAASCGVRTSSPCILLHLPVSGFADVLRAHPGVLDQLISLSQSRAAADGARPGGSSFGTRPLDDFVTVG